MQHIALPNVLAVHHLTIAVVDDLHQVLVGSHLPETERFVGAVEVRKKT